MKIKAIVQYVFSPLVAIVMLLSTSFVLAREAGPVVHDVVSRCPEPLSGKIINLDVHNPYALKSDFTSAQWSNHTEILGDSRTNIHYLHTFQWKKSPNVCCHCTSAVLTVNMESNLPGRSATSSDAGNDTITIMRNGVVVLPYNEKVYSSFPFPIHTPATKQWQITGTALKNMCKDGRLSIDVQDDTMVLKNTNLQIRGCCLTDDQGRD